MSEDTTVRFPSAAGVGTGGEPAPSVSSSQAQAMGHKFRLLHESQESKPKQIFEELKNDKPQDQRSPQLATRAIAQPLSVQAKALKDLFQSLVIGTSAEKDIEAFADEYMSTDDSVQKEFDSWLKTTNEMTQLKHWAFLSQQRDKRDYFTVCSGEEQAKKLLAHADVFMKREEEGQAGAILRRAQMCEATLWGLSREENQETFLKRFPPGSDERKLFLSALSAKVGYEEAMEEYPEKLIWSDDQFASAKALIHDDPDSPLNR